MTEVEKARICRLSANLAASQPEGGYLLGSAPERPSDFDYAGLGWRQPASWAARWCETPIR